MRALAVSHPLVPSSSAEQEGERTDLVLQLLLRLEVALLELVGELAKGLELVDVGLEDLVVLRRDTASVSCSSREEKEEEEEEEGGGRTSCSFILRSVSSSSMSCASAAMSSCALRSSILASASSSSTAMLSRSPVSEVERVRTRSRACQRGARGRRGRTLQIRREVELLLHRLDLALELCLALSRQVPQSVRQAHGPTSASLTARG